jgi:hypothetical protein
MRSAKHRLYLVTYVGVGFALAAFGLLESLPYAPDDLRVAFSRPTQALLAIPLIVSFFLL